MFPEFDKRRAVVVVLGAMLIGFFSAPLNIPFWLMATIVLVWAFLGLTWAEQGAE
jgi:hypothetical protein